MLYNSLSSSCSSWPLVFLQISILVSRDPVSLPLSLFLCLFCLCLFSSASLSPLSLSISVILLPCHLESHASGPVADRRVVLLV